MTELSYFWDGVITGDAVEAPYNSIEFNNYMFGALLGSDAGAYVFPAYLNNLEITNTGTYSVNVATGAAAIKNQIYINDSAFSLVISPPSIGAFRYDYIILRYSSSDQTVRCVVLKGVETTSYLSLAEPTLTQTAAIWEVPIARLYLDGDTSLVESKFIIDKRIFAPTTNSTITHPHPTNLISNSEFLAYSTPNDTIPPEGWESTGALTFNEQAKTPKMGRGRTISFSGAGSLAQVVNVEGESQRTFTLKGTFDTSTGSAPDDTEYTVTVYAKENDNIVETVKTQAFTRLGAGDDVEFQCTFNITATTFNNIFVDIASDGDDIWLGQLILVPGYHPGPFRAFEEMLMFFRPLTDASWADTAKSSATTTIDLTTDFQGMVLPKTRAVYLRVRIRDSGSAAGSGILDIDGYAAPYNTTYGSARVNDITNDTYREVFVAVPIDRDISYARTVVPRFRAVVTASGALTADCTIEVLGVQT